MPFRPQVVCLSASILFWAALNHSASFQTGLVSKRYHLSLYNWKRANQFKKWMTKFINRWPIYKLVSLQSHTTQALASYSGYHIVPAQLTYSTYCPCTIDIQYILPLHNWHTAHIAPAQLTYTIDIQYILFLHNWHTYCPCTIEFILPLHNWVHIFLSLLSQTHVMSLHNWVILCIPLNN